MCLAIPAKIIELHGHDAVIEVNGVRRKANVAFIKNATVGEYVIVHAGFAIQKLTEDDVAQFNDIMEEMAALDGK